jgi:hypothetical protein
MFTRQPRAADRKEKLDDYITANNRDFIRFSKRKKENENLSQEVSVLLAVVNSLLVQQSLYSRLITKKETRDDYKD